MKAMKKALALGLALAMVVTAVPVTSAQAASTAKLSASTVSVAAGTAKKQTKSVKVTTPSTWKSVKVTASSSDKKIATVKVSGKTVKVTAVKKGSAKVTVKVSAKKSGKTVKKTLTAKVTVINAGLRFVDPATEVVVGESVALTAKKSPNAAVVTFKSSDDTIATVDADGKVTAVKAGKVTITATSDYGKEVTTDVTVKNVLLQSVKQTKANVLEAVILGNTKDIKATDIAITNTSNKNVIAVKSVSVDANDATKVTIETFADMTDAATYSVELDKVVKEFVATDAVVIDVTVSPLQITADTEGTEIKAQLLAKDGIVISEFKVSEKPNKVDFTLSTTQGYVSGDKLVLPIAGNKGTAEVTYHTYKYDEKAQEIGAITKKFEIVAVDSTPATISGYNYTIGTAAPDWEKVKPVNTFSISDTVNAYFYFIDSNKKDVTSQYKVVSSNNSILLLPETQLTNNTTPVSLVAVKPGSAYINVLKDGKVVTSLPVVVTEARKLTNITLDAPSLTVSNVAGVSTVDVNVKAFDQTGAEIALDSINVSALGTTENLYGSSADQKKVTITATNVKEGTYTVKIEAVKGNDKVARTIPVNVVKTTKTTADATDLRLVVDATEIDLAVADDATTADKKINVSVAAYEKGAKLGNVALTSVQFGNDAPTVTTGTSIAIDVAGKAAGTYTIIVEASGKKFTANVVIKNTQVPANVKVIKNTYTGTVSNASEVATMLGANAEFYYNGKKLDAPTITVDMAQVKTNGSQVYVGTVKVTVKNSKGTEYQVDASVNATFTVQ